MHLSTAFRTQTDTNRTVWRRLCSAIPLLLALLLAPAAQASDAPAGSMVFESTPDDGHLRLSGSGDWDALRGWQGPAELYDDLDFVKVNTRPDVIYRGFIFFDTSALPDDVDVSSAVLHIYAKCTGDLADTGLYILAGTDGYPHQPLVPEDYALPAEALLVCAKVDTGGWTHELAYRDIVLGAPETVVRADGVTKLVLLERRDYENDAPPDVRSENELKLYTYEEGEGFRPYLEVFWGGEPPAVTPTQLPPAAPVGDGTSVKALVIVALAAVGIAAGVVLRRRRRPPAQGQAQETVHRPF